MTDFISAAQKAFDTSSNPQVDTTSQDFISAAQKAFDTSSNPWSTFKQSAESVVNQRGLPKAIIPVMLGQAALESARGTSNFAKDRNNYFGYGAFDSNPDNAKSYATPAESINDYLDLVMGYKGVPEAVQTGSPANIIQAIKNNGYATDPNYVSKVMSTPEFQGGYN
jgi:flagellum-specific peptidoglycan hydrolase FlgJ